MDGLLTPANTSTAEELEKVFVFCMIWAMGSALTVSDDGTDYQKFFSDWWRGEWKKVGAKRPGRRTAILVVPDRYTHNIFLLGNEDKQMFLDCPAILICLLDETWTSGCSDRL